MNEQIDVQKLGSFIRELRVEKEITQKDLGERIGVSDKAVSKWERGLSFPDITLLPGLAKTFNVSVDEIINGERNTLQTVNIEVIREVVNKTMDYSKQSYSLKGQKIACAIIAVLALLASAICLIVNIAASHTVSWSLYPIGALLMVIFTVSTALFCKRNKLEATALTLFVTLSLYLILIRFLSATSGWVMRLGLPVAFVSIVTVYCVIKSFMRMKNKYYACATTLLALGIGPVILVNIIVSLNGIIRTKDYTNIIGIPASLITSFVLYVVGYIVERTKRTDEKGK